MVYNILGSFIALMFKIFRAKSVFRVILFGWNVLIDSWDPWLVEPVYWQDAASVAPLHDHFCADFGSKCTEIAQF